MFCGLSLALIPSIIMMFYVAGCSLSHEQFGNYVYLMFLGFVYVYIWLVAGFKAAELELF